jgi:plasmid stability protein
LISSTVMKQLLLRIPDDVHRRLVARAARDGRSMNRLATEILDLATDVDNGDRRARLAARAASLGVLRGVDAGPVTTRERRDIVESTRGIGPVLDELLAGDRDRE